MKTFWKFYYWLHIISGTIVLILTIVFSSLMINKYDIVSGSHSIIGIIVLATVIFQFLFGIFTRNREIQMKWKTIWILRIMTLHKVKF
jgi:cytochrome b